MKKHNIFIILLLLTIILSFYNYGTVPGIISFISALLSFITYDAIKSSGIELNIFKKYDKNTKILDATVLTDSRCLDMITTGFLGNRFIIPKFLIEDFQKKTNVNDEHIRNLSRKALDIISRLRENENIKIEILDIPKLTNYKDNLIQLAKQEHAQIITFDYEITKLGLIYGIKTLNLTELSISLKQAFLPGDELTVFVMKEGKDKNQGVAYLEDGTMVVVENGYSYIGKKTDVIVQSILKNSNGKIIFTKAK